jgi:microcystin-dependent protein
MADPFVAEIRIFPFTFAPKGWAFCAGQLLPISQNTALFSLLGTFYGGDGKSTFALPNLQGSVPIHVGQGPGLSEDFLGQQGGVEFVTLLQSEMPAHSHSFSANNNDATVNDPSGALPAKGLWDAGGDTGIVPMYTPPPQNTMMAPDAIGIAGGSLPHNNMMPYLTLNFCIAMQGVFPPRP